MFQFMLVKLRQSFFAFLKHIKSHCFRSSSSSDQNFVPQISLFRIVAQKIRSIALFHRKISDCSDGVIINIFDRK